MADGKKGRLVRAATSSDSEEEDAQTSGASAGTGSASRPIVLSSSSSSDEDEDESQGNGEPLPKRPPGSVVGADAGAGAGAGDPKGAGPTHTKEPAKSDQTIHDTDDAADNNAARIARKRGRRSESPESQGKAEPLPKRQPDRVIGEDGAGPAAPPPPAASRKSLSAKAMRQGVDGSSKPSKAKAKAGSKSGSKSKSGTRAVFCVWFFRYPRADGMVHCFEPQRENYTREHQHRQCRCRKTPVASYANSFSFSLSFPSLTQCHHFLIFF